MRTVNVHDAKTQLSKLLVAVEAGESFTIARAGKPVAKMIPADQSAERKPSRIGMLEGQGQELVRAFDEWSEADQARLEADFYGEPWPPSDR